MSDNFELDEKKTKVYEKRSSRYQNTKDSAISLFIVGGIGAVFLALSFFKVIPITLSTLSFAASATICILFLILGVISLRKSRLLKAEAEEEEAFSASVCNWLEANVDSFIVDTSEDLSEADLYFLRCQQAKELLLQEFPNTDEDFIDMLLDENYDKLFSDK